MSAAPALGVCYYPEHWDESRWADDARRMAAMGLRYVRIGEFAWSRLESADGALHLEWLDRAIATLGDAGLEVVLGTPTATPPKWLCDRYPEILPVGADGAVRRFGSRRHADLSSPAWLRETERIVTVLAERYGQNPHVAGWQIDNELGCHATTLSYSPAAAGAFRAWLSERYGNGTVEALNRAWGNVFWSMEYGDFAEIDPPNLAVTETNPAHRLAFQAFASDQVRRYIELQAAIIRRHSPGRFVTHNGMGGFLDYDHFTAFAGLDLASWDSYPLGHLDEGPFPDAEKVTFARTGHPDGAALDHDLYRRVGRGRFWVMEQQPGPVNWASWNPAPLPGMVRLWTWQAIAHGAEVVSYFRWRQCPFAQEQMHAGLHRPDDALDQGGAEATRVAGELRSFALGPTAPAHVALMFDYAAGWVARIQPQGRDFDHRALVLAWYGAVRRLGLDVDVVAPGDALDGYALVLVPSLPIVTPEAAAALVAAPGLVLCGPRTGSKTADFAIPDGLPPGPLADLLGVKVVRVESMRPGVEVGAEGGGAVVRWREFVEAAAAPALPAVDGNGLLYRHGRAVYLAGWPDRALLDRIVPALAREAGLTTSALPEGLRLRRRGELCFAFNFGPEPVDCPAPDGATFILGQRRLEVADVAAWRL